MTILQKKEGRYGLSTLLTQDVVHPISNVKVEVFDNTETIELTIEFSEPTMDNLLYKYIAGSPNKGFKIALEALTDETFMVNERKLLAQVQLEVLNECATMTRKPSMNKINDMISVRMLEREARSKLDFDVIVDRLEKIDAEHRWASAVLTRYDMNIDYVCISSVKRARK